MPSSGDFYKGIAMYTAQRDSKAALLDYSNSSTYKINTDYITVEVTQQDQFLQLLWNFKQEDFKDEISISDDPVTSSTNLNENYNVRRWYILGIKSKIRCI